MQYGTARLESRARDVYERKAGYRDMRYKTEFGLLLS